MLSVLILIISMLSVCFLVKSMLSGLILSISMLSITYYVESFDQMC
jgi:hypothetical protein